MNREWDNQQDLIVDNAVNNNVVLVVSNQRFPCDKISLQNASPYFQAMFNSAMLESEADEVFIRDVDPDVFKVLVDYAHRSELPIITSNENDLNFVFELLKTACIFQFDDVSKQCCKCLYNLMDISNCLKIWDVSEALALPDLHLKSKSHAFWYGNVLLESDEVLEASFEILLEIVSSQYLRINSELCVLNAVIRWVKDNDSGQEKALKLFNQIRFVDLTPKERKSLKRNYFVRKYLQIVHEDLDAIPAQFDAAPVNSHSLEMLARHTLKTRSAPFKPLLYGYSFHGRRNKLKIHFYIQEDMYFKEISSICVFFKALVGFGVCVVGKDVYMFGGREKVHYGKWNEKMWKYDSLKEKWTVMADIPFCRRHFRTLVVNRKIFALGGCGEHRITQTTMFSYDTTTETWKEFSLPTDDCFSFAVTSGKYQGIPALYFFAKGLHIFKPGDNPGDNIWIEVISTPVVNSIHHGIEYGGNIYLMTQDAQSAVKIHLFSLDEDNAPIVTTVAHSLSEDCTMFTILNGKVYIYTDNGVEIIAVPSNEMDNFQAMFKWRNEQRKPFNAPLKYVGLLPYFGK